MVIVAIKAVELEYLRFYIEVGVSTFVPTPTPSKIPSDSDFTVLVQPL
jgi:hypothetical protein